MTPTGRGATHVSLHTHRGAVWVTNIGAGTLVRVPVRPDGTAGTPRVAAHDLGPVDDFAFAGDTVLAAVNQENRVIAVDPAGQATTVLTEADGLAGPTSVAVRGRTVYVTDGAYFVERDPNLLLAPLSRFTRR